MSLAIGIALGLPASTAAQNLFIDVTAQVGIDAPLTQDKPAGGIGVGDFNGNGWPDLFLTGYFEPNRLYFNDGQGGFYESPVIAARIAMPASKCAGVAVADFDNDGWPDVYLVCDGDNYLLRNLQGQDFVDVTPPALNHQQRSEAAAWADLTGNGHLDLTIAAHPRSFPYDPENPDNYDRIVLHDGNGNWADIMPGLELETPIAATLALAAADIDLDGHMDLYFANDRHDGNTLLLNRGPGCGGWCFEDASQATGANRPAYSMGIAISDFDRDGDIDLFFSSIAEQILLVNQTGQPGMPTYQEGQSDAGINASGIGWGVIFLDIDNDGLDDLFLAISGAGAQAPHDRLFLQTADGSFTDPGETSGLQHGLATEAAARIDFDRDGRMDLVLGHSNLGYRLYRNVAESGHHWLAIELVGGGPVNRDAIGAAVRVITGQQRSQRAERRAGESRGASHDPVLHFGLGPHTAARVLIDWPDGRTTDAGLLAANRHYRFFHPAVDPVFSDAFESN